MFRPIGHGERLFDGNVISEETFLRIGRIVRVDYAKMKVDINWVDAQGGRSYVPLTVPFCGYRSGIVTIPEENSLVVCGWIKQSHKTGQPIILSYLSIGVKNARLSGLIKQIKDTTEEYRLQSRGIYPGEIHLYSSTGSEIYIEDGIRMSNKYLNEFQLRDWDQANIQTSLQRYMQCEGMMQWQGKVWRSAAREANDDHTIVKEPMIPFFKIRNGKRMYFPTLDLSQLRMIDGGIPWIEDRSEILEYGDNKLLITEFNADKNIDRFGELPSLATDEADKGPMIVITKGTVVGNDPYDKKEGNVTNRNGVKYADRVEYYGFVLQPFIFERALWDAVIKYPAEINIRDEVANGAEMERKQASCFRINFPNCTMKSGDIFTDKKEPTKIDFSKEGKLMLNIARSGDTDPLGKHRSIEANINGSIKMTVGRNYNQGHSIYVNTAGSITQVVEGYDNHSTHKHYGAEGNNLAKNTLLLSGCENYEMHGGDEKKKIHGGSYYLQTLIPEGDLIGEAITPAAGTGWGRIQMKADEQVRVQTVGDTIHIKSGKDIVIEANGTISFACEKDFIVKAKGGISLQSLGDDFTIKSAATIGLTAAETIALKGLEFGLMTSNDIRMTSGGSQHSIASGDILELSGGQIGHRSVEQRDFAGVIHHNGPAPSNPTTPATPEMPLNPLSIEVPIEPF